MKKENNLEESEEIKGKEILYRGKSLEYLKSLDVREAAKFLPSRSRRSVLRNFDKIELFLKRCEEKTKRNKKIKTHIRELIIVPKMVGYTISVYNGRSFEDVHISVEMIGHTLGEFAPTRKRVVHGAAGIGATKSSKAAQKK